MPFFNVPPWQRNQSVMVVVIFVTLLGFSFVTPFLPIYMQELGVSNPGQVALWAGLAMGVAPLMTAMVAPFWGSMADRYGYKLMLQRALLLFVVIMILMGLAHHPWQVFGLRALHGLLGGFGVLSMTLVTITAPKERRGEAISLVQSARILGAATGPVVGGVLAANIGIRYSCFVTASICAIAFVLVTWGYRQPYTGSVKPNSKRPGSTGWQVLISTSDLTILFFLILAIQSLAKSYEPMLPLYMLSLKVSAESVASVTGLGIGLTAGAGALATLAVGRWVAAPLMRLALLFIFCSSVVGSLMLAAVISISSLLSLLILLGAATGAGVTLAYTIGTNIMPEGSQGAGIGMLTSATMLGSAVGPLFGSMVATVNLRSVFLVNSVLYMCAAVGAIWLLRKQLNSCDNSANSL